MEVACVIPYFPGDSIASQFEFTVFTAWNTNMCIFLCQNKNIHQRIVADFSRISKSIINKIATFQQINSTNQKP